MALQGFDGVRAYGKVERSRGLLEEVLGATAIGEGSWELRGAKRGGTIAFDAPPAERGAPGAGTIHHVAFAEIASHGPGFAREGTVEELGEYGAFVLASLVVIIGLVLHWPWSESSARTAGTAA